MVRFAGATGAREMRWRRRPLIKGSETPPGRASTRSGISHLLQATDAAERSARRSGRTRSLRLRHAGAQVRAGHFSLTPMMAECDVTKPGYAGRTALIR